MGKVYCKAANEVVDFAIQDGVRVYLKILIQAPRSINSKAARKADEVIFLGMSLKTFIRKLESGSYVLVEP